MRRSASLGAGAVAVLAVGLAGLRLGSDRGNGAEPQAQSGTIVTKERPKIKTLVGSKTGYQGGCTAYLPPLSIGPKDGGDANRSKAYEVIERFLGNRYEKQEAKKISTLHFAIALVPDPRHTHLSMIFDRSVEAIEDAAQDSGYTYNSSWLPWSLEQRSYELRAEELLEETTVDALTTCPGILLFRRSLEPGQKTDAPFTDGLLVFVVGEQPTGGLNVDEWENAVQWLRANGSVEDPTAKTLHVLGPTFSGTLPSLEQRLDHLLKPQKTRKRSRNSLPTSPITGAYVFSGTVGSCRAVQWFQRSIQADLLPVTFGVFQENDELQIYRLLQYLAATSGDVENLQDIAILSEDETAYGFNGEIGRIATPPANAGDLAKAYSGDTDLQDLCDFPYDYRARPVRLFYPRDISAVRIAYEKQALFTRQNPASTEGGKGPQTILNSQTEEDSSEVGDTVPNYSRQQSTLGEEAELYGLVSFLRSHHTRLIVLRSSNPLDYLFLTRFLHHAYPEGRIVTVGSEILFRREVDTTEFRGTMSLTNYPLLPQLQHWTRLSDVWPIAGHAHRIFPAMDAEGTYIAMRMLLDSNRREPPKPSSISEGFSLSLPGLTENIPDFADPFWLHADQRTVPDNSHAHAATWLTVIGQDGYWPIALLNDETTPRTFILSKDTDPRISMPPPPSSLAEMHTNTSSKQEPHAAYLPLLRMRAPLSWKLFLAAVVVLLLWHTAGCSNVEGLSSLYLFNAFRARQETSHKYLLAFSSASAIAIAMPLIMPWASLGSRNALASDTVVARVAAGVLLVCAILMIAIFSIKHSGLAQGKSSGSVTWPFLLFLASFVFLNLAPGYLDLRRANAMMFYYRSVHLNNGVSPIMPLFSLMIGLYVWSWQILAGNALLCAGRPLLPDCAPGQVPQPYELGRKYSRLSNRMSGEIDKLARPWTLALGVWLPPAVIAALCLLCFFGTLPILTLEGHTYTLLINCVLLLAVVLIGTEASRLFMTWRKLQRLLVALERTPLCRTFSALKDISLRSLWSMSGNVPRTQFKFFDGQLKAAKRLRYLLDRPNQFPHVSILDELIEAGDAFSLRYFANINYTVWWEQPVALSDKTKVLIRPLVAKCAAQIFNAILQKYWDYETCTLESAMQSETSEETRDSSGDPGKNQTERFPLSRDPAVRAGEEVVCLLYISYFQNILARIRTMVFSVSALYIAVALALAFYPFVPRPTIAIWMLAMLIILGAVVGVVFAGMERNKILSYITNTSTELGWEFWAKYAVFLIPPVLAMLTAQFPEIANSIGSWVQPTMDAVK